MSSTDGASGPEATAPPAVPRKTLSGLLAVMVGLLVVGGIVWATRPKPAEVYVPPPQPVQSAAEIRLGMEQIKNNPKIAARDKERILGFMKMSLDKAEKTEAAPSAKP